MKVSKVLVLSISLYSIIDAGNVISKKTTNDSSITLPQSLQSPADEIAVVHYAMKTFENIVPQKNLESYDKESYKKLNRFFEQACSYTWQHKRAQFYLRKIAEALEYVEHGNDQVALKEFEKLYSKYQQEDRLV